MAPRQPFLLSAGEGESVWSLGGLFTVKLAGGNFSLLEVVATRAAEPPLHIHHREDEAFYVLEGDITFQVADQALNARSGSFVFAPRGIAHAFTVDVEPTRVLLFASPSGFEGFAIELGVRATASEPAPRVEMPGPEVMGPVAERYGIEVIGPPLRMTG